MFDLAYLGLKAASNVGVAGVGTRIALACGLVALGAVLAFDSRAFPRGFTATAPGFPRGEGSVSSGAGPIRSAWSAAFPPRRSYCFDISCFQPIASR